MRIILAGCSNPLWKRFVRSLEQGPENLVSWCNGSPPEVMKYCHMITPCILVVNHSFLENFDPSTFAKEIDYGRTVQVLVEMEHCDPSSEAALMQMSCSGTIPVTCPLRTIRKAVAALENGQLWMSRNATAAFIRSLLRENSNRLTEREQEILNLIGAGLKNHEIAERLFISPDTVRWHLRSLYGKLGVHDRANAGVQAALRRSACSSQRRPGIEETTGPTALKGSEVKKSRGNLKVPCPAIPIAALQRPKAQEGTPG